MVDLYLYPDVDKAHYPRYCNRRTILRPITNVRTYSTARRCGFVARFTASILLPTISIIIAIAVLLQFSSPVSAAINEVMNLQGKLVNSDGTNITDGSYYFQVNICTTAVTSCDGTAVDYKFNATIDTPSNTTLTYTSDSNESSVKAGMVLWNTTDGNYAIIESIDTGTNTITVDRDIDSAPYAWGATDALTTRIQVSDGIFNIKIVNLGGQTFNTDDLYIEIAFDSTTGGGDSINETFSPRKRFDAVPYAFRAKYSDNISCTDCIDFTEIADVMDLDNNLIVNLDDNANHFGITVNADLSVDSRPADMLALSVANDVSNDFSGDMIELNLADADSAGRGMYISNLGTGDSLRIDDVGSDTTPVIIDDEGNLIVGGTTTTAIFSIDTSTFTARIGTGSTSNGVLTMYASDNDTGSITYNTSDQWSFTGGDVDIDGHFALGSSGTIATTDVLRITETLTDNSSAAVTAAYINPTFNFTSTNWNRYRYGARVASTVDDMLNGSYSTSLFNVSSEVTITDGSAFNSACAFCGSVTGNHTGTVGTLYGANLSVINDATGTSDLLGIYATAQNDGGSSYVYGGKFVSQNASTLSSEYAYYYGVTSTTDIDTTATAGGTMQAFPFYGIIDTAASTVTNTAAGFYFDLVNAGSITTTYGIYLKDVIEGTQTNAYGIWANEGDWILDEDGGGTAGGNATGGDLILGEGQDLEFYHDGTNSYIVNNTGSLYLTQAAAGDIILQPDNDTDDYLYLDTTSNYSYLYWEGQESNDPGIGVDSNGNLVYRDNNESGWTLIDNLQYFSKISDTTNTFYLTDTAGDFTIGGSATTASIFGIDESAANFYFGYDNSASPTLLFEASDNDAGSFGFNTNDAFYFSGANVGIGVTDPDVLLEVYGSTTQLKLSYDGSNYLTTTVANDGGTTFDATGTSPDFTFSDNIIASGDIDCTNCIETGDLETATNEVSESNDCTSADNSRTNHNLTGGEYGFYPVTKTTKCTTGTSVHDIRLLYYNNTIASYRANVYLTADVTNVGTGTAYTYAQQTYIQASPPYYIDGVLVEYFLYHIWNKDTGFIQSSSVAEDPPWENFEGDTMKNHPHPFPDYVSNPLPENLEIAFIDPSQIDEWKKEAQKQGVSLLQYINVFYEIDPATHTPPTSTETGLPMQTPPGTVWRKMRLKETPDNNLLRQLTQQGPDSFSNVIDQYPLDGPVMGAGDILDVHAKSATDPNIVLEQSTVPYSTMIAGVMTEIPSYDLSYDPERNFEVPLAQTGRAKVHVSLINGPIETGDPITSSSIPGVGMKATEKGFIVGKALSGFDLAEAQPCWHDASQLCGEIDLMVNLTWYEPHSSDMAIDLDHQSTNALCSHREIDGTTSIVSCSTSSGDIAEWYDLSDGEAGDIVAPSDQTITYTAPIVDAQTGEIIDDSNELTAAVLEKSSRKYQQNVLGVVSTSPVQVIGSDVLDKSGTPDPISISGRTPVKVSSINGSIKTGDPISSSTLPGVGMLATEPGTIIGYALEPYENSDTETIGKIMVAINISWYEPQSYTATIQGLLSDYINGSLGGTGGGGSSTGWEFTGSTISTAMDVSANTFTSTYGVFSIIKAQSITIGDSKFVVDSQGNVDISGDLTIAEVIKGRYGNLTIALGDNSGSTKFAIKNSDDKDVFTVDSSGKIGVAEDVEGASTNAVAGTSKVPAGNDRITIETTQITDRSKIQITFRSDYSPAERYWIGERKPKESFTIVLNAPVAADSEFDWWIVN